MFFVEELHVAWKRERVHSGESTKTTKKVQEGLLGAVVINVLPFSRQPDPRHVVDLAITIIASASEVARDRLQVHESLTVVCAPCFLKCRNALYRNRECGA